jgi:hypothetical protein
MAFNTASKKSNAQSNVDWDLVNSQIAELVGDANDARIAAVVELGIHPQGDRVNGKGVTFVNDEEAALDLIEKAEDIVGLKTLEKEKWDEFEELDASVFKLDFKIVHDKYVFPSDEKQDNATYVDTEKEAKKILKRGLELDEKWGNLESAGVDSYEEITTPFKLPFNIYDGGEENEFGLLGDLTATEVTYVEGQDPVNYRVNLCSVFKGEMTGFPILDSYKSTSVVSKICKATGNKSVLGDMRTLPDLAGSSYFQVLEEKKGFINISRDFGTPRNKDRDDIAELNIEGFPNGVVITFDDATVEQLEAIKLNKLYVEKIKAASNYEGSQIQKAIDEWEANRGGNKADAKEEDSQEEESTKPEKKKAPAKKAASKKRVKKEVEPEPEEYDDDIPF